MDPCVSSTLVITGLAALASGSIDGPQPPCDQRATQNAINGPLGYAERIKPGEANAKVNLNGVPIDIGQYCEGFWRKLIGDGSIADDLRVTQAMISRDLKAIQAEDGTTFWVIAWPFLAPDWGSGSEIGKDPVVKIKGRSSGSQRQYQLDASEDTAATTDRSFENAPGVELFAWKSEVLRLSEEQQALAPPETRYRVVRLGEVRGIQDEEIVMPTMLNPSGTDTEEQDLAVHLRVHATSALVEVESVSIRVLRSDLTDIDEKVAQVDLKLSPRQQRIWTDSDQLFSIPVKDFGGRTIEVRFTFNSGGQLKREAEYVYVPTVEQTRSMQRSLQP